MGDDINNNGRARQGRRVMSMTITSPLPVHQRLAKVLEQEKRRFQNEVYSLAVLALGKNVPTKIQLVQAMEGHKLQCAVNTMSAAFRILISKFNLFPQTRNSGQVVPTKDNDVINEPKATVTRLPA
jgi:hypothetical protein